MIYNIAILLYDTVASKGRFQISKVKISIFNDVENFINKTSQSAGAKIYANLKALEEGFREGIKIKTLRGKIKEIIINRFRVIFFELGGIIYVVDVFVKKSTKTPQRIIKRAERIYNDILEYEKNKSGT